MRQLLYLTYAANVAPEKTGLAHEIKTELKQPLAPGFRVLADLTRLEHMDHGCAAEIGRVMELVDQAGVDLIVRVVPDASKDIGFNILTIFHYRHAPKVITCENLPEAVKTFSVASDSRTVTYFSTGSCTDLRNDIKVAGTFWLDNFLRQYAIKSSLLVSP